MLEEIILNSFIGIEEENDEYLLKNIDSNNKLKQNSLSFFLSDKNNISSLNINLNESNNFHSFEYFKETIENINIEKIENDFKKILEDYNQIINILDEKIKEFKKRNDEQIFLAKKIIDIYNYSINSDKITNQILLNTKNILNFNSINKNEIFPDKYNINLDYNILKTFPIDNYIEEQITIQNIQKTLNIRLKEEKKYSFLYFEEMNKFICYNENKIISFNSLDFTKESELNLDNSIISINLTKDENIYIGFSNSIKKLNINNNEIIIEDYLNDITLYKPGKIIKYKCGLAWIYYNLIVFNFQDYYDINEQLNIEWNENSGFYKSLLLDIIEYKNDNIIYLYSLEYIIYKNKGCYEVNLGFYKKESCKYERLFFDSDEMEKDSTEYLNKNYKITEFKRNKIIVFTIFNVFIVDVSAWKIIKKISFLNNKIINCYNLKEKYYLFLFKYQNNNNIIFYKLDEVINKIIFKKIINFDEYYMLYFIQNKNHFYIISHKIYKNENFQDFSFYKIINLKNIIKLKNEIN